MMPEPVRKAMLRSRTSSSAAPVTVAVWVGIAGRVLLMGVISACADRTGARCALEGEVKGQTRGRAERGGRDAAAPSVAWIGSSIASSWVKQIAQARAHEI